MEKSLKEKYAKQIIFHGSGSGSGSGYGSGYGSGSGDGSGSGYGEDFFELKKEAKHSNTEKV